MCVAARSATAVDQAGSLAITHLGKLLILCERHVYETLSLAGLTSTFSPDKAHWCVLIDLLDARVAPGGRDHERVTAALRRLAVVQLLLVWQVEGEAREPSFPAGIAPRGTRRRPRAASLHGSPSPTCAVCAKACRTETPQATGRALWATMRGGAAAARRPP